MRYLLKSIPSYIFISFFTVNIYSATLEDNEENNELGAFETMVIPSNTCEEESLCDKKIYVIAANRFFEQDPLSVAQSMEVITYRELNEGRIYGDVEQALQELPNVSLGVVGRSFSSAAGNPNNNQSYWDEGVSIRGLGGQRVLIVNDGVRQANQGLGYGGGNMSLYDLTSIGAIEVLKGPSSVIYGTDAIGGVVSIRMIEPEVRSCDGFRGKVKYDYDNGRNYYRTSGFLDVGSENFGLVVGGMYSDYQSPHLPHNLSANGGSFERYGFWGKFNYYISDNAKWSVYGNRLNNRDIDIAKGRSGAGPFVFDIPRYDRYQIGTQLDLNCVSDCIESVVSTFNFQEVRRASHRNSFSFPLFLNTNTDVLTNDRTSTYEWSEQIRFDFFPHNVIGGFDVGHDRTHSPERVITTNIGGVTTEERIRAQANQTRLGVYVQDTWDLYPFEVTGGIRYDWFDVKNELNNQKVINDGVSGSLGLIYHASDCVSYYGTLTTGFRVPDLSERFQNSQFVIDGIINVFGNPLLSPERSYGGELGVKGCLSTVSYQAAVFYNLIDDYIGVVPSGASTFRTSNIGAVTLYGVEGQITYRPDDYWKLYFNGARTYTDQRSKISIPSWVFNYGVSYKQRVCCGHIDYIEPEIWGRSVASSYDTLNSFVTRADTKFSQYTTLNAQIKIQLYTEREIEGRVLVGISNILDRQYREAFLYAFQPGRGFFTSLEIQF